MPHQVKATVLAICSLSPFSSDFPSCLSPFHPSAPVLGHPLLHPHSHLQIFAPGRSSPQIYTLPSPTTSGFHANITLSKASPNYCIYKGTLPGANCDPRPLHLSPLPGSSSDLLSSLLDPSSEFRFHESRNFSMCVCFFFTTVSPLPTTGPDTLIKVFINIVSEWMNEWNIKYSTRLILSNSDPWSPHSWIFLSKIFLKSMLTLLFLDYST